VHILVVEDDDALGAEIVVGLRDDYHVVDLVTDGAMARNWPPLFHDNRYDVAVLDVKLPGVNGLDVCTHWRRRGLRTPVLMLTALQTVEDRVYGLDAGADDYLTKPFAFAELLARLRALGRRETTVRVGPLTAGDLRLDPLTHRVERAGRRIELTAREYAILELMLRHQGQVFTRGQIAAHAWELGTEHASNVVDVFVKNIRRKIDEEGDSRLLHTVRGVGYTLRVDREAAPASVTHALR